MQFCKNASCCCSDGLQPPKIAAVTKAPGGHNRNHLSFKASPLLLPSATTCGAARICSPGPAPPDQISERGRADHNNKKQFAERGVPQRRDKTKYAKSHQRPGQTGATQAR